MHGVNQDKISKVKVKETMINRYEYIARKGIKVLYHTFKSLKVKDLK